MEERLAEQLRAMPEHPGAYLFRDAAGKVVYVGKAVSLRDRVRSHFAAGPLDAPKHQQMVEQTRFLEYIVTDSEQEALLLEYNLIKRHRPRYNVRLKDDKSYPYLRIDVDEEWAQVYITRRLEADGARYFGPYASVKSVRQTLDLIKKLFPYRSCTRVITGADPRPCLDYHIRRCVGPCIGATTQDEYQAIIRQVILFLEGRQERVVRLLRDQMNRAADRLDYERAAAVRDQIRAVERTVEQQKITSPTRGDLDVVGLVHEGGDACAVVMPIRGGKLIGCEAFPLEGSKDETDALTLESFLTQYYGSVPTLPPLILLPFAPDGMAVLQDWLRQRRSPSKEGRASRLQLLVPRRGERRRLVAMAEENARQSLVQQRLRGMAEDRTAAAMDELVEALGLPQPPLYIEGYDISNIRGTAAVGSMVVFEKGKPRTARYRRFNIKAVDGIDDYAMMREVLQRRFKRVAAAAGEPGEGRQTATLSSWATTPDLVLIDGGRGHLNTALEALRELGADGIPVAALAKENEELYIPQTPEPIVLDRRSAGLQLLQRVRDESHRFALAHHTGLRRRTVSTSLLDAVPGIGPRRKRALLRRFGSLRALRDATIEEMAAVEGITVALAQRLKEYL